MKMALDVCYSNSYVFTIIFNIMVKPHYDVGVETQTVQIFDDFIFCNTIGATSGRGTAIISGAPKFIPKFCGVIIDLSLSLFSDLCRVFRTIVRLFVIFLLAIALSVKFFLVPCCISFCHIYF